MKKLSVSIVLMLVSVLMAQNPASQIQQMEKALTKNPDNFQLQLNVGKLKYQQVMEGDKRMLKPAVKHLKKATKIQPESSTAHCWYGSAIVMKAKYATFPPMKSYYVVAGLKEMDQAIELNQYDVESRFIRGQTCMGIPKLFGRANTAIEDFSALEKMANHSPDKFDDDTKAKILYYLSSAYENAEDENQAKAYADKLIEKYPHSEFATSIK